MIEVFENHDQIKLYVEHSLGLSLVFLLILILLTILTIKRGVKDDVLSIPQTNQIRGFAISLIVIHHLSYYVVGNPGGLPIVGGSGPLGVAIFLIISGFGISISLEQKGSEGFFLKRLVGIYIPIILAMSLEIGLNYTLVSQPKENIAQAFLKIFISLTSIDRNLWFINFLFLWYLAAYLLVFRSTFLKRTKQLVLVGISVLVLVFPQIGMAARLNAFSFPVGYWAGSNRAAINNWLKTLVQKQWSELLGVFFALASVAYICFFSNVVFHHILGFLRGDCSPINILCVVAIGVVLPTALLILMKALNTSFSKLLKTANNSSLRFWVEPERFALACFVGIFSINFINQFGWTHTVLALYCILNNVSTILGSLGIVLLISLFSRWHIRSEFLNFMGDISFEVYLLHGMFLYSFDFILFRGNLVLTFILYFAALCLASLMLQRVSNAVSSVILMPLQLQNTIR